jgi:Tol biopolymer transport system component
MGTGKRTLFTMPASGGEATALTDDDYFNWSPVWSSDGSYLYYASNRGGTMDLWRLPMDLGSGTARGAPQPVTVSPGWSAQPRLSRDGQRVLYAAKSDRKILARRAIDPVTRQVASSAEILMHTARDLWELYPSPDGEWLSLKAADPHEDIFICKADGSGLRRLTSDPAKDRQPRWTAGSDELFFFSDRSGRYEIWSIRADGGGLRQITATEDEYVSVPSPSPDGTKLLAMSLDQGSGLLDLTLSLPTSEIEWFAPIDSALVFYGMDWSPDGTRILGHARPDGGVYVMTVADQSYQRISTDLFLAHWFDNRTILAQREAVFVTVDIESGEEAEIFAVPEGTFIDSWGVSRDNRWFYYIETHTEGDIWMLDTASSPAL